MLHTLPAASTSKVAAKGAGAICELMYILNTDLNTRQVGEHVSLTTWVKRKTFILLLRPEPIAPGCIRRWQLATLAHCSQQDLYIFLLQNTLRKVLSSHPTGSLIATEGLQFFQLPKPVMVYLE